MNVTIYPSSRPSGINFSVASTVRNISGVTVSYSDTADPFVSEGTIAVGATATLYGTYFFVATATTLLSHVPVLTGSTEDRLEQAALRLGVLEGAMVYLPAPSTNAATDLANLLAANATAVAAGGGTILARPAPSGSPYLLNGVAELSSAPPVNLRGVSKDGTIFKLTTAGARIKWAEGGGGDSGDFSVWGGTTGARVASVGIEVGICNQRSFRNIDTRYTTADGWQLNGTQNCSFTNCTAYDHDGNGWGIDKEAGANNFYNCGASGCLDYAVEFRQTALLGIGLLQPSYNHFYGGVFERPWAGVFGTPGTHALGLFNHKAGVHNTFSGSVLSLSGITSAMSLLKMSLDTSGGAVYSLRLTFEDCEFTGGEDLLLATCAELTAAGNTVDISGRFAPVGFLNVFKVADGTAVRVGDGWEYDPAFYTNWAVKNPAGATPVEQLVQRTAKYRFGSKTWNPASIATGFTDFTTVTVQGAAVGDLCAVSLSEVHAGHLLLKGQVTSAGVVTVTVHNTGGATEDIASGTLRASVWSP